MISLRKKPFAALLAVGVVPVACGMAARPALADSSYQSQSQITGGVLKDQMSSNPLMSRMTGKMFAPITTSTMVHGNQKAVVRQDATEIWDLDAESYTHIDTAKKTYWVVTFAEMRQGMQNAMNKMSQATPQPTPTPGQPSSLKTDVQVSVDNPGVTKAVNGVNAQEQIVTLTVTVTDTSQPQSPGRNPVVYVIRNDVWVAVADPPELKAISDFDVRMAKVMMQGVDMPAMMAQARQAGAQGAQLLASQPGAAAALERMGQEMAKLKGTRVMTVTSLGGIVPAGSAAPPSNQNNADASAPSMLPGKLGAVTSIMGGFHKKQQAQPAPAQPATTTATPAAGSNVVLMETTEQMLNFSEASIPASAFQVPAGYTKVSSPFAQMSH